MGPPFLAIASTTKPWPPTRRALATFAGSCFPRGFPSRRSTVGRSAGASAGVPGLSRANWSATPTGFEGASNTTKPSETDTTSTGNPEAVSVSSIVARQACSKCSKAAHLAHLAANAVRDYDLDRALELLAEIALLGSGATSTGPMKQDAKGRGR
jgi:hypothetical protein